MPFDGMTPPPRTAAVRAIDDVLEFFGPNGERWLQRQDEDADGRRCLAVALDRCRYSPAGAYAVLRVLGMRKLTEIPAWNDVPGRRFEDVRAVLLRAREMGARHAV